ncbi:MAG TPA: type II toxin-antitoxin system HicB family antitoxin [Rhodothermales bacterium]|nr:type II toxin-antitoxin system HicB family antitoxin [Rhodothermales bacterium]
MLTAYIEAAMRHATYEILEDGEGYYGEIPGIQGVWANAETLEACRDELQSTLEDWILFRLHRGREIPVLYGLNLNPVAQQAA